MGLRRASLRKTHAVEGAHVPQPPHGYGLTPSIAHRASGAIKSGRQAYKPDWNSERSACQYRRRTPRGHKIVHTFPRTTFRGTPAYHCAETGHWFVLFILFYVALSLSCLCSYRRSPISTFKPIWIRPPEAKGRRRA